MVNVRLNNKIEVVKKITKRDFAHLHRFRWTLRHTKAHVFDSPTSNAWPSIIPVTSTNTFSVTAPIRIGHMARQSPNRTIGWTCWNIRDIMFRMECTNGFIQTRKKQRNKSGTQLSYSIFFTDPSVRHWVIQLLCLSIVNVFAFLFFQVKHIHSLKKIIAP